MESLETLLLALLMLAALPLIGLILIQQGKGADMGAAFGSGASNTLFGADSPVSFLSKLTGWLAFAFFVITFATAHFAKQEAERAGQYGVPKATAVQQTEAVQEDVLTRTSEVTPDNETAEAEAGTTDQAASDVPVIDFNAK